MKNKPRKTKPIDYVEARLDPYDSKRTATHICNYAIRFIDVFDHDGVYALMTIGNRSHIALDEPTVERLQQAISKFKAKHNIKR